MSTVRVNCSVVIPEGTQIGEFANAFRVLPEVGPDCLLDFLLYSANAQQARVVSRVRIRRDFIPALQERLRESLAEFTASPEGLPQEGAVSQDPQIKGTVVTMPNGDVVVFGLPGDGDEEN